ncbi:MAG TPA: zinc ribbon domain-containing protein [Blastocatellia bacterium]|nr:zinc ribbon domain-containing protein [Blastocatellia bacterium]
MFCPKCGGESVEGQRFCKTCGTNLQLINDAIRTGDSPPGPFGFDVEALSRNAKEFAESWKKSWSGVRTKDWTGSGPTLVGLRVKQEHIDKIREARRQRRQAREEARLRNLPRPRDYMSYSWQHNLRNGLLSLFWGSGLGVVLYYLGQTAINDGLIRHIEETSNGHVQGLEPLVRIAWMIALLPVLKGLAKIVYAAFFAESMATLTARFTAPPALPEPAPVLRHTTAPVAERETVPNYEPSIVPPPSVTENTTQFFEEEQRQAKQNQ